MRLEGDAVVVDVGEALLAGGDDVIGLHGMGVHRKRFFEARTEAEDLEAARIGECRTRPIHKRAEAAGSVDDVGAGL